MRADGAGDRLTRNLQAFALSTVLTVVAFTTYVVVAWTMNDFGSYDGAALASAAAVIGVIWLIALGVLAIRARVSGVWVGLGAVAGWALVPVVSVALFLIRLAVTGESLGD